MSILKIEELSKRYGGDFVLRDVSCQFSKGDRVALIGINGSGKSTLLKLITGQEEPSAGSITMASSAQIGYLSQEPNLVDEMTLFDAVISAKAHVLDMENELRKIEQQLAEPGDHSELLHKYDEIQEKFMSEGGYEVEAEVRKILTGLGFTRDEESKPVAHLSGGERARVALARLLLEEPDVLLLDEPTNHLDLAAIEWLESYLLEWRTGFIISSHDRYFIDKLATRIWEVEAGNFYEYPGNYTKHLELKQGNIERKQKLYDEQQEYIKKSEDFIRKNIAGGEFRENQAKARRKMLEKLERLEPPHIEKTFSFRIEASRETGKEVLNLSGLEIGYNGDSQNPTKLFTLDEAHIRAGDRIGLIGPNGSGKSSFIRAILDKIPPLSGEIKYGYNVEPAYFRQSHWEEMDPNMTVLDCLMEGKHQRISEARDFLGKFLFSEDDVYKHVGNLSGGERSRLSLARLAQLGGNLLVLDEPTNHLDIRSREVLENALKKYEGTILFVSHDRYLIQSLATQVWEIRRGKCRVYRGDYEFYLRKRASESDSPVMQSASKAVKSARKADNDMKRFKREVKKLEKAEQELARKLAEIEASITETEKAMETASYNRNHEKVLDLNIEYEKQKRLLEQTFEEWSAIAEQLQNLAAQQTEMA